MLQPVTEIAREFNSLCNGLAESVRESEAALTQSGKQEKVSKAIQVFFESLQRLPDKISSAEFLPTILFEIDCSLNGIYGSKVFSVDEAVNPLRKILRDLAALWQKNYLITGLGRHDGVSTSLVTAMSFYDAWKAVERVPVERAEYDCLVDDTVLIVKSSDSLNLDAKVVLFALMGKILVTLGFGELQAQDRLQHYIDEIRARREDLDERILPEIVLCLQVLAACGKGVEDAGIDVKVLQKALRFWSSRDEFLDRLFKSWGWHWEYDFVSPLAMGDQLDLRQKSMLYNTWSTQSAKLGIGHSFLELREFKRQNPQSLFQPIPIFMFGGPGVGKSSYLLAFCHNAMMRTGRALALGPKLRRFYDENDEAWRGGNISPTATTADYTFWEDPNIVGYTTFDYGGKEVSSDQSDPQMQERFRTAKGLLFFIDESDYTDSSRGKKKGAYFAEVLGTWMASNPHLRHIPVGVVLTKCDVVFGEDIKILQRNTLLPPVHQPGLIESLLHKRFTRLTSAMNDPMGRLTEMIVRDRVNNLHPVLQDTIESFLENFSQFLTRVLDLTYNYQIFLTSSVPPSSGEDRFFPWGVREPMTWMIGVLEKFHLQESIVKFKAEEKTVEDKMRIVKEDMSRARLYREEIEKIEGEIKTLRLSNPIWQTVNEKRIKWWEDQKQKSEQDLEALVQRYTKDPAELHNRVASMQAIEREVYRMEEVLSALRDTRTAFESRLRADAKTS